MEISSFHQFPDESLSKVLDCFHDLLLKTPTYGFSEPVQLNIFIDGLQPHSKQLLDASASGKIKLKTPDEAMELIENMEASDHAIIHDRDYTPKRIVFLSLHLGCIASSKQAPGAANKDPHRDSEQASTTVACSATCSIFSQAN